MEIVFAGQGVVGERCRHILRSLVPTARILTIHGRYQNISEPVPPCDVLWSVHWPIKFTAADIAQARVAALNVHNSYLPWNRGADSCYWALKYARVGLPPGFRHGATVHWLDEGLDTGPICWQLEVAVEEDDTAEILYDRTANDEVWLFTLLMRKLLAGEPLPREPQAGESTFHTRADRNNRLDK